MKKGPPFCCLLGICRGWNPTQLYRDYKLMPWNKGSVFKQPGFNEKSGRIFVRGSVGAKVLIPTFLSNKKTPPLFVGVFACSLGESTFTSSKRSPTVKKHCFLFSGFSDVEISSATIFCWFLGVWDTQIFFMPIAINIRSIPNLDLFNFYPDCLHQGSQLYTWLFRKKTENPRLQQPFQLEKTGENILSTPLSTTNNSCAKT